MRKILSAMLGFLFLMLPLVSEALTLKTDGNLGQNEVNFGNLYLSGGAPVIAGNVQGDLVAAGGTVVVTGTVDQDVLLVAANSNVSGKVLGDVRIVGGSVYIDGAINGDVFATGVDVRVGANAVIQGDFFGTGASVYINPQAKIFGKKLVPSEMLDGEDGKLRKGFDKFLQVAFLLTQVMTIVGLLLIGMVFFGLFPNIVNHLVGQALQKGQFWKNVGLGVVLIVAIPMSALLCFISGIGVLLGIILAFVFALLVLVNMITSGYIFGALLYKLYKKPKKFQMGWGIVVCGIAFLHLISLIPYVGLVFTMVFLLLSWGSLARVQWKLAKGIK